MILSERIGDYSALTRREQVGLVLHADATEQEVDSRLQHFLESYHKDPAAWRERCRRVAREQLDSSVHLPKIAAIYERLSP